MKQSIGIPNTELAFEFDTTKFGVQLGWLWLDRSVWVSAVHGFGTSQDHGYDHPAHETSVGWCQHGFQVGRLAAGSVGQGVDGVVGRGVVGPVVGAVGPGVVGIAGQGAVDLGRGSRRVSSVGLCAGHVAP